MKQDLTKLQNLKMKSSRNFFILNLVFIFIFLNIWDFVVSRELFNAMLFGILLFGPVAFLWYLGRFRAVVLVTLISIVEFLVMTTFVLEGLQLSGTANTLKSIFYAPFLVAAGINGFWGLKIYSDVREKKIHQ